MSILLELRKKIASKRYELIGEGKDGHVYHYDEDKVIKLSKSKSFIDSEVLTDLNGLSTFPKLYKCSSKWYIAEKFEGISIIDTPLKEDWEDILAKDVEEAYKRGWYVADLHAENFLNVDGYIKILDVGRFVKCNPTVERSNTIWTLHAIKTVRQGGYVFED